MTIDAQELRRLLDEARLESGFGNRAQWADENGDALLDAADRLARIEAALGDVEKALKTFATILPSSFYAGDGSDNEGYCALLAPINGNPTEYTGRDLANARAALAALRELIGEKK